MLGKKVAVPLAWSVLVLFLAGACSSEPAAQQGESNSAGGSGESEQEGGSGSAGGSGEGTNIGRPAKVIFGDSYVSPLTEDFGDIFLGGENFIASSTVLRAAPGLSMQIGKQTTIHDNVIVRAMEDSVTIGEQTTVAHHGIVRDSQLGNSLYIGYGTEIDNSRVGDGSVVYHGARVEGVEIPENRFVGAGEEVTDQATADALPTLEDAGVDKYYTDDLLEIDQELRRAYLELYEEGGYDAVIDVGVNPTTSFNPEKIEPQIPDNTEVQEFARILGDVQIGENSTIGRRTAIRADEGSPILIGPGALIDDRVTFHAIKGTDIQIGQYLAAGDDAVLHGPLEMGDSDVVGEGAVVFRVRVGDNVQIGDGAIIAGPPGDELTLQIPDDALIPAGAVITSEEDLEDLEN